MAGSLPRSSSAPLNSPLHTARCRCCGTATVATASLLRPLVGLLALLGGRRRWRRGRLAQLLLELREARRIKLDVGRVHLVRNARSAAAAPPPHVSGIIVIIAIATVPIVVAGRWRGAAVRREPP